jgi:hypothetical protein
MPYTDLVANSVHFDVRRDRRLIFVSADDCGACIAEQPKWVELLELLPVSGRAEVVFVGWDGALLTVPVRDVLDRRGIPWTRLRVRDVRAFTTLSGIKVTPTLIATDGSGFVRAVVHRLNDEVERVLIDALR